MADVLKIQPHDNVAVALRPLKAGEYLADVSLMQDVPTGHKFALKEIIAGNDIIKYGNPIGHAKVTIQAGEWVHTHNVSTNLSEQLTYSYEKSAIAVMPEINEHKTFLGYMRADGRVGIRNELWVIPTVGCVNQSAKLIAEEINELYKNTPNFDGAIALVHPYGCSQLGEDHARTRNILAKMADHPNAGGVLVLGLGCENNTIAEFKQELGEYDARRIAFLTAQDVADEVESGVELARPLVDSFTKIGRTECGVDKLVIGLKCGGSDGFSGITANPLVGVVSDIHIGAGGATILTEVPEMFGAEQLLMARAKNEQVFEDIVHLINDFKTYYQNHNQPVYENPSPGNKDGGITTLEDKSLGCVQKGGTSEVVDVLAYGQQVRKTGLSLLSGPGNDGVACTVLAAAGCHIILFTTGRGTPLGTVVPTMKIATNSQLFNKKTKWMDFDAGQLLAGKAMDKLAHDLYNNILDVASGKRCKAELMGHKDLVIFKSGVTV